MAIQDLPIVEITTPAELLGTLNDIERKNAPERLYLAGHRDCFDAGTRISVVGSRRASDLGRRRTELLAQRIVAHGMVVVSGLAEGVDTVAHETALASGGRTIAILGTPLDDCFPAANRGLQSRIVREHLAISQFERGMPSVMTNFPRRNRTMALLSDATIIVEAGEKSGTVHQGWEALRLGRPLFLLESVTKDDSLTWPRELIRYGAQVLTRELVDDVLLNIPRRTSRDEVPF